MDTDRTLDIIVALIAVALVIFTIVYNIKKFKKGSCSCGCGCTCGNKKHECCCEDEKSHCKNQCEEEKEHHCCCSNKD